MKRIQINIFIGSALILVLAAGCSKILKEEPRSIYTPEFLKTEKGIQGGITSLYAHLRYIYGQAYYYNACETGTDEATWAQQADGNFKDHDLSGVGQLTPSTSRSDVIWGTAFSNINTANGIIDNASTVGLSAALIAEAKFFRAFDYFLLVQTFGGVPLDLGSGELKFNTSSVRISTRNTVPEVYTKAIFPDLVTAVNDLPAMPRTTGAVTKALARLYLAKAYLTYAWWLQNPNNIPTYPETPRTDPDGHNAQWYFQQAYDIATTAIENPGPFALQPTFYDIHVGTKDRNNEIMLYADHTEKSEFYNASSLTYGSGGAPDNFAGWMMTWNYTEIQSSASAASWGAKNTIIREAEQHLGRPWTRMCPTIDVIKNTFADKTNDSRYDGTFTTVYRGNWNKAGDATATYYNANFMQVKQGDALLTFLNDEPVTPIDYTNSTYKSNIGAGVLAGRPDFVISPNGISRIVYPGLWKLGPYRTDNAGGVGQPNASSTRPYNIAKFSELYFVAAEAAVMGATPKAGKSARELINVIRARAGKWSWDNNGNVAKVQDKSAAMTAATPATIDIYYILAERSREYYGEGYRWFDLVRTQKWAELAGSFKICGTAKGDHTPVTYTRTIQPYLYLRPIPSGQIQAMDMTDDQKKAYQNPVYQ
ncbi:MAG: RagB/SusD family nutrient uptake outer membrane protein [Niastella sp.]|uniref:RagB/SusD family nutrient uptake outer membrane protein n=1 Tax=Niastella sp. TaxID=1869183 RepID=UPI003899F50F